MKDGKSGCRVRGRGPLCTTTSCWGGVALRTLRSGCLAVSEVGGWTWAWLSLTWPGEHPMDSPCPTSTSESQRDRRSRWPARPAILLPCFAGIPALPDASVSLKLPHSLWFAVGAPESGAFWGLWPSPGGHAPWPRCHLFAPTPRPCADPLSLAAAFTSVPRGLFLPCRLLSAAACTLYPQPVYLTCRLPEPRPCSQIPIRHHAHTCYGVLRSRLPAYLLHPVVLL